MEKERLSSCQVCIVSAAAVAILIIIFCISLIVTFDFSEWNGIGNYQSNFHPVQMFTVVPSLLLAIAYTIFVSGLHSYAPKSKKVWSQLALSFGLLYAGISIANYLIQLITVIPSVQNGTTEGLALFVSGYSNSIFYALMASYFFMCISLFFSAFVFERHKKHEKAVRRLFVCSALAIPFFLTGAIFNVPHIMMLGAVCWIIGTTVGMSVLTIYIYKINKNMESK